MICSHYEVFAYDLKRNVLASIWVYSFDEAYFSLMSFERDSRKP